jgi:hypothetical protein
MSRDIPNESYFADVEFAPGLDFHEPGLTNEDLRELAGERDEDDIPFYEPEESAAWTVVTLEDFAAVEEPGAEALLGDPEAVVLGAGADFMAYGDGGAGKTTLCVDLACHLAAGDDWLGIPVKAKLNVLLIENEGPRPLLRAKLRRKRDGWQGSPLEGRCRLLEEPWAQFSFAEPAQRTQLAAVVRRDELDVVIIGPLTASGMDLPGTLQETRAFAHLLAEVRAAAERPVVFGLVHHENRGGQVSGAWEAVGDLLLHVQGQGHGRTRLVFQKARWASRYHGTHLNLLWTEEGEGFTVEDKPELDDDAIRAELLDYVRQNPGTGWTPVDAATEGRAETKRRLRDGLLAGGELVNIGKDASGQDVALDHIVKRKPSQLYVADDPTIRHLRPPRDADGTQTTLRAVE